MTIGKPGDSRAPKTSSPVCARLSVHVFAGGEVEEEYATPMFRAWLICLTPPHQAVGMRPPELAKRLHIASKSAVTTGVCDSQPPMLCLIGLSCCQKYPQNLGN